MGEMCYLVSMAMVTPIVRELAASWVDDGAQAQTVQALVRELERGQRLPLPAQPSTGVLGELYPVDEEGYAQSLDVLEDEELYGEYLARYGFVVGRSVISADLADDTVNRIREMGLLLSDGAFDIADPKSAYMVPLDPEGVPLFSRGFYEIYHDHIWARIRQSLRLYLHHTIIWGTPRLWSTFDRFGVKPHEHPESVALPLHTDQSPLIHSDFRTIQGILALCDCPLEIGVTVMVPGSRTHFQDLAVFAESEKQYLELSDLSNPLIARFAEAAQPLPLRAGDILTWDSRCVHANTANFSANSTRYVALVAAGRARSGSAELLWARSQSFKNGLGVNERDAYLHASIRPRYQDRRALAGVRDPEVLDALGERLYGLCDW
jgi:hypothetical protein